MKCRICGKDSDLRLGACFICAEAESIIADGTDMYDKGIDGTEIPAKTPMEKLKLFVLQQRYLKEPLESSRRMVRI